MLATISLYAMAASITDLFLFLLFLEQIDKLRIGRHAWCVMRFGRERERERRRYGSKGCFYLPRIVIYDDCIFGVLSISYVIMNASFLFIRHYCTSSLPSSSKLLVREITYSYWNELLLVLFTT
jgi:hypothetical protein